MLMAGLQLAHMLNCCHTEPLTMHLQCGCIRAVALTAICLLLLLQLLLLCCTGMLLLQYVGPAVL